MYYRESVSEFGSCLFDFIESDYYVDHFGFFNRSCQQGYTHQYQTFMCLSFKLQIISQMELIAESLKLLSLHQYCSKNLDWTHFDWTKVSNWTAHALMAKQIKKEMKQAINGAFMID